MKKFVFIALVLLTLNVVIIFFYLNDDSVNLTCKLSTNEYNVQMKDTVTLKFENSKLNYKKEIILIDYSKNEASNDIFLSYVDKFKANEENYTKENWNYKVNVNGRKIKITIVGNKNVKEINDDTNDYNYYKNYYENLAYSCN